jgi:REP element-mobilizing transposase RayT
MSRKTSSLLSTTGFLHVYNRGVDRGTIFFGKRDYEYFMALQAESLVGSHLRLLLHCLLPNHFHLVVQQSAAYAISGYMKRVSEAYAKFVNGKRMRCGHLFQDRFKVRLFEESSSLVRLSHYIHYNPVVAGLVPSIFDWKYSSIHAYAGSGLDGLVTVDPILRLLGSRDEYIRFLREYDPSAPESVWEFMVK